MERIGNPLDMIPPYNKGETRKSKKFGSVISGRLRKYPPMIRQVFSPEQIMSDLLTDTERNDIIEILNKYGRQKLHEKARGWSEWSAMNVPDGLSEKWKAVLYACRANGFIGPYIYEGKIKWLQILKSKGFDADRCTMCPIKDDDCYGLHDAGTFVPCWRM